MWGDVLSASCSFPVSLEAKAIFPAPGFGATLDRMQVPKDPRGGAHVRGHVRVQKRAFTLIELMVVVLIMGILAVVGGASFVQHTDQVKNTQALAVCRSIGVAQERYRTLNGRYLDVSGNLGELYPTADPGGVSYHFWGHDAEATYANWLELAPEVPVYVRYSYAVVAGLPNGAAWPALGVSQTPTWPATVNDPWYIVKAVGDLDGDNDNSYIIMSSFSDRVYMEAVGE